MISLQEAPAIRCLFVFFISKGCQAQEKNLVYFLKGTEHFAFKLLLLELAMAGKCCCIFIILHHVLVRG